MSQRTQRWPAIWRLVILSQTPRIEAALFRHLLDNAAIPLIGSGVGSLLVAWAQYGIIAGQLELAWLAAVYLTIGLRLLIVRHYRARQTTGEASPSEAMRFALTVGLSGVAWGLAGLFLIDTSPIGTVVTITAILAMVMGAALTLSAFLPAFFAFTVPAILPMILVLATRGGTGDMTLALYSAIFLLLIIGNARRFNNTLRQTWQLSFDKEDLLAALTKAHDLQSTLAQTDGLTGIANRRRFDAALQQEISRHQRSGGQLALLILDVDHFKNYNDTYGHLAGDACLQRIAEVLGKHLHRGTDLAARYGGEEFAGILPATELAGALWLAEQIRTDVEKLDIEHAASANAGHITVSIGVASLPGRQLGSPSELIDLADQALYTAKLDGRNRVLSAPEKLA
ncbi:GGDEF domain-containing protein [Quatrionicoccus australiensis]|uniref:GGDEF domain-containing protein n=1 Tax=Quatrionicoccus australiensis TaxID=138118 RepID=UPI001CF9E513|nr:diguanylate cyclase [Quatrionicoccus australiensis]MCB4359638.1 GGDEF domain-containing protein [Quatrionicoccus australiensis]